MKQYIHAYVDPALKTMLDMFSKGTGKSQSMCIENALKAYLRAILSSMNLYSGSAGGGVLEAGIVSFEDKVVNSQTKYISDLLEKTESPDITSFNKYWGHR